MEFIHTVAFWLGIICGCCAAATLIFAGIILVESWTTNRKDD